MEIRPDFTPIAQLKPMVTGLNLEAIIIEYVGSTNDDTLHQFLIGDESGCIDLWLWGDDGRAFKPMEIVRISGAYTKLYKHSISLYLKQGVGRIQRCGRFRKLFSLEPNISQLTWTRDPMSPYDPKAYIVKTEQPVSQSSSTLASPQTSSPSPSTPSPSPPPSTKPQEISVDNREIIEKMKMLIKTIEAMPNATPEFKQFQSTLVNIIQQQQHQKISQPLPPQVYTLVTQLTQNLMQQQQQLEKDSGKSLKRKESPE